MSSEDMCVGPHCQCFGIASQHARDMLCRLTCVQQSDFLRRKLPELSAGQSWLRSGLPGVHQRLEAVQNRMMGSRWRLRGIMFSRHVRPLGA